VSVLNDVHDDVLVTRFGRGYRWYPNPESRKGGSQRWAVPSVSEWHSATDVEAARAGYLARGSA
jgi:hypothetical protein